MFQAIGEVGGVNQAKGGRREHLLLLAAAGGFAHERGRIPFAEGDGVAAAPKPLGKQGDLGGLAGAVDSFDNNQAAKKTIW